MAAAVAAATACARLAGRWAVQVPGGALTVALSEKTSMLTGPAVIVAEGVLDHRWLSGQEAGNLSGIARAG